MIKIVLQSIIALYSLMFSSYLFAAAFVRDERVDSVLITISLFTVLNLVIAFGAATQVKSNKKIIVFILTFLGVSLVELLRN